MRYAVTGHQPHLLGGYSDEVARRLVTLAERWISRAAPTEIISGMAAGWDMAVAEAAIAARVPLVAALAWADQGRQWPEAAQQHLFRLLCQAKIVHVMSDERTPGMWTKRDMWVIERSDRVVALSSGVAGGTADAIATAVLLGKPVENLWEAWSAAQAETDPGSPQPVA